MSRYLLRRPVLAGVAASLAAMAQPLAAASGPVDSLGALSATADTSKQTLGPISVTGAPLPGSPLSQAAEVDVVDSDAMEVRGASNLGEALDSLAGVDSIGTGKTVGKPVIRGLSGERIRILSNGVGLDHQQYGVRHMPTYDTFSA